jgi:hypothetical protein
MTRVGERGAAMLVTMVVTASLLAGAAALASMQLVSHHATDVTKSGLSALYCAEAGLVAASPIVAANYSQWASSLGTNTEPVWLQNAFSHDLDGDPSNDPDFVITLKDNDDELPPLANDPFHDNDLKIYIISTCRLYPDTPKQIMELVQWVGGGTCYNAQEGGCGGNGNQN